MYSNNENSTCARVLPTQRSGIASLASPSTSPVEEEDNILRTYWGKASISAIARYFKSQAEGGAGRGRHGVEARAEFLGLNDKLDFLSE